MISKKLTIQSLASLVKNKRIFFRADFNVPLKDGKVANTKRIVSTLPSIKFLLQHGAKSITMASHLGRPQGQNKPELSLSPVTECLSDYLGNKVKFLKIDDKASIDQVHSSNESGKLYLLQNLRFNAAQQGKGVKDKVKYKASQDDINNFRSYLSSFGQIYINDAFGTSHRPHSSMVGVNTNGPRAAGFLVEKELKYFSKVLESPQRPLVVFMGGAKVHDKLPLLKNLINIADQIVIGGAIAFTFLKVHKNVSIGNSLFDQQGAKLVPQIMKMAKDNNVKIHLPQDILSGTQLSSTSQVKRSTIEQGVPNNWMGLDVGEKTLKSTYQVINRAKTMFWNGPYGAFEFEPFSNGSRSLLKSVIDATTNRGMISVAGGGDTINMCKLIDGSQLKLSHVSTGGGASLELMEGRVLPGIDALSNVDEFKDLKG